MGLANATLMSGGTLSVTGGTSKTYAPDGVNVANGIHLADFSVTDARIRPSLTAKNRPAAYDKTKGVWVRGKRECVLTIPKVLASGITEFPNVRIIIEDHPEMTDAELTTLLGLAGQIFFDTDFTNYVKYGSLA